MKTKIGFKIVLCILTFLIALLSSASIGRPVVKSLGSESENLVKSCLLPDAQFISKQATLKETDGEKYALIYNGPVAAEDCPQSAAAVAQSAGLKVKFIADIAKLPELLEDAAVFIIGGHQG